MVIYVDMYPDFFVVYDQVHQMQLRFPSCAWLAENLSNFDSNPNLSLAFY